MNWKEVTGHEKITEQIRNMIKARQFPNAVIFSGAEGIGKRKVAEITAMALLCENENAPCGNCDSCRAFIKNSHSDFYLLEPDRTKANPIIKIEQVRELQREVAMMPVMSNSRTVLIDDAEYMNGASQNCLLKTLEEPTGLTKFILITSKMSRLLMTIRSRCMIINFERLSEEEIIKVLEEQNIENAKKISLISNGSLGQAIKLAQNEGLQIREDVLNFLESLIKMNVEDIFSRGKELSSKSKEYFREWIINLQKILRDILITGTKTEKKYYYNLDITERLAVIKENYSDAMIFSMLKETAETERRLNSNMTLQLLMESYFMRMKKETAKEE